jgi:hypothetical protein
MEIFAISIGMNCRPFAVVAVVLSGLVPAFQPATAGHPTHRRATATATILSPVAINDVSRGKVGEGRGSSGEPQSVKVRFVDENGFVTAVGNPRRHVIHIIDLP